MAEVTSALPPVRVYLDTSDYAAFCAEPRKETVQDVWEYLVQQVDAGAVEVGFSWAIISELIQDFDEEHRQNRVKRAETVKQICGANAFCYPTELKEGNSFSRDGYWFPSTMKAFNIRAFEKAWIHAVGSNKTLIPNRAQRNALKNVKLRRKALRQYPQLVDLTQIDLGLIPLTDEFVNEQYLYRFMVGKLPTEDANKELLKIVTDPVRYIVSWFDMAGKTNTFSKDMQASFLSIQEAFGKMEKAVQEIKSSLKVHKKLEREMYRLKAPSEQIQYHKIIKSRLSETLNFKNSIKPKDNLLQLLGDFGYDVFLAYFEERLDPHGMKPKSSDIADIIHALYIPHCDLWRGDSSFAHMLVKRSVTHSDRVVPKLSELPDRIDSWLRSKAVQ
jgi:hypothetical protein